MDRRDFLASAAVTLAASSPVVHSPLQAKPRKTMLSIVDTHQHLWDKSKVEVSWLKPENALYPDHTPKEYAEAIKGLPIAKSIYMEVDVKPTSLVAEAEYVIGICQAGNTPMVAAVIGGRPNSAEFTQYLDRFKNSPFIKGVRQCIHTESTPPGYSLTKEFIAGVRALGERGLRYDICIRSKELPDADKLVEACPDTQFVLDHCGNAPILDAKAMETWKVDIDRLAKRKNLVCKISGIVASAKKGAWTPETLAPAIRYCINSFGWDRVMFGGDWPVCTRTATYSEWVKALQEILAQDSEINQKKLFYDNAIRFYQLGR